MATPQLPSTHNMDEALKKREMRLLKNRLVNLTKINNFEFSQISATIFHLKPKQGSGKRMSSKKERIHQVP